MCQTCLSWYARCAAPYLVHAGCSANAFAHMRRRMIPLARGVVVEVGIGSGLNLPFYDASSVKRLVGVDPDGTMLGMATRQSRSLPFHVECIRAGGESLPLADGFADTVVVTYAFCTIPDPQAALDEIRRVLKPTGQLIFIEHGKAEGRLCRKWQERLNGRGGGVAGGYPPPAGPRRWRGGAVFGLAGPGRALFPPLFWQLGSHHAGIAAVD